MENPLSISSEELTLQAEELYRRNDWTHALDYANRALSLSLPDHDSKKTARLKDLAAQCQFMTAFFSNSRNQFLERVRASESLYEEAALQYRESQLEPFYLRAKARSTFAKFWLTTDAEQRKALAEKSVKTGSESAELFRGSEEQFRTNLDLLWYLEEALSLSGDRTALSRHMEQALEVSTQTIDHLEAQGNDLPLLEALHRSIWLRAVQGQFALDQTKFQAMSNSTLELGLRISKVSQRVGSEYASCLADESLGDIAFNLKGDYDEALSLYTEAFRHAQTSGHSLLLGRISWLLANVAGWKSGVSDSPELRRSLIESSVSYCKEAIRHLVIPHDSHFLAAVHATEAESLVKLATLVETDTHKTGRHLEEAIDAASRGAAIESDTLSWLMCAHAQVKAAYSLSLIKTNPVEKQRLIENCLPIAQQTAKVTDALFPSFWNSGVVRSYQARIKTELAKLQTDSEARVRLLTDAVSDMNLCIDICQKWATPPGLVQRLGQYGEWLGDILFTLHQQTLDPEPAERSIVEFRKAHEYFSKIHSTANQGNLSWKIAKVYDHLGGFKDASDIFRRAAEEYDSAVEKVPALSAIFEDLKNYMKAWTEIEKARVCHIEGHYGLATKRYNAATRFLNNTKSWNRLSLLLKARALLEKGESFSQAEKHRIAIECFETALDGFRDARIQFEKAALGVADQNERAEIEDWLKVARQREPFARGRLDLERARFLDKTGNKLESSQRYHSASADFRMLSGQIMVSNDRAEMEALAQFCSSWALMEEAESKRSPQLFATAAESFLRTSEISVSQTVRHLSMGNASVCRALESGTKFRDSRSFELYSEVKRHLEAATDRYSEAGFRKTEMWARATQRLFDAFLFLTEAEVERETGKKTSLYGLAEKHLELAARLYGRAGFPTKKREALNHLENTREEKEVLRASLENLADIPALSNMRLPSVALGGVRALGLERFEEANVSVEVKASQTDLTIGSTLSIEFGISNVGKEIATLVKLEGVAMDGFEKIVTDPEWRSEGDSVDLKGIRLEHLKSQIVRLAFRASKSGLFELKPTVIYANEKGSHRSTVIPSFLLRVRDLGSSKNLGSAMELQLPEDFRFKNERSRRIFQHLVKEFLRDHMGRRFVAEKAGWRSKMDIVEVLKFPRSTVYGAKGKEGSAVSELERRGLVEIRVFPGERGRTGNVEKLRVAYENSIVKGIIERAFMQDV